MALGLLIGIAHNHHVSDNVMLALGTGFCGTLTTYSTFSYETLRLHQTGDRLYAAFNIAISLLGGLGAALVGLAIGSAT